MKNDIKCFCPKCNESANQIVISLEHDIVLRWDNKEQIYIVADDSFNFSDVSSIICSNCLAELNQENK
ncbi:MAG: hypothetical protein EPN82_13445 [Bacteroidetes bacterium]|nr:MAG: hypothetical protein EPN82_13445 [Bacteroidota bacterium]